MNYIQVDWSKEYQRDTWDYVGRDVLLEKKGEYSDDNPCGIEMDDGLPMMNCAYPLHRGDISIDKILEVCEHTNCTVVYNNDEERYYLALTGGGMDLSQDIALAYMISDGIIDWDMLCDVYIDSPLSVNTKDYTKILNQLKRQLEISIGSYQSRLEKVNDNLESLLE